MWPRPCDNMEVQLKELPEYFLWAKSFRVSLWSRACCGFDVRLPKKSQGFCLYTLEVMRVMSFLCLGFLWPSPYDSTHFCWGPAFPKLQHHQPVSSSSSWKKSLLSMEVPSSSSTCVSIAVSCTVSVTLSSGSWQLAPLITEKERWLGVAELRSRPYDQTQSSY